MSKSKSDGAAELQLELTINFETGWLSAGSINIGFSQQRSILGLTSEAQ
jgi:hypothetical protein